MKPWTKTDTIPPRHQVRDGHVHSMHVEFDHVCKCYGTNQVFKNFTGSIHAGTLLAVLGVNGAGKTTMLRMLAGLAGYDRGLISFDGKPAARDNLNQRRRLCFIPDVPTLFGDRSILENIAIYVKLWNIERSDLNEQVLKWLEELDLLEHADKPIGMLSRGQIFKAGFCALMAVDPELWLIDEPFASGMDPQGISMFRKYAQEASSRGRTVILHHSLLDLAETFSDRIWVIHQGQLVANGPAAELKGGDSSLEGLFGRLREQ